MISLKTNLILSGVFSLCYVAIRLYTWISISGRLTAEIGNTTGLHTGDLIEDLGVAISISLTVIAIALLVSMASVKASAFLSYLFFSIALLLGFSINQFFVITLTPLSADLFGYSLSDVGTTVSSSGSTLGSSFIICILIIAAFIIIAFRIVRAGGAQRIDTRTALGVSGVMMVLFFLPWRVQPEDYENDLGYYVAVNKFRFLANRTIELIAEQSDKPLFPNDAYPFLHKINYSDSLGAYLNKANEYPNLVVIIIEGLGRDFCGPNAPYGGFTPFLDSLTQKSLYWENGLSNAGRTFGAPPSILGSLPYAKLGMMGYGNEMPSHQTLISLLKPFGYTTNFFYGGNPNFDNLDLFLERQQVDFFLNQSNFPEQKKKAFWGYSDADLFSAALQKIDGVQGGHRLDVFLTLNTHEPFVCPDSAIAAIADKKIDELPNSSKKEIIVGNKTVFECLLYTDYAVKGLMQGYARRPDFNKTIFVITGDHRLIPVPQDNRIKRYHVPILIYSPLLKQPKSFSSLTTHSAILPSILSFLHQGYAMDFPEELPLISSGLPMQENFSSNLDIALIRNKNEVKDYILGGHFLSEDRLYTILQDLKLKVESNELKKRKLKEKLRAFQGASIYAFENNRLDKVSPIQLHLFPFNESEERYLQTLNIKKLNPDERFAKAKELAFNEEYQRSRTILKNILNQSPNYHDARILLARTYAWQSQYDSARLYLDQTIQRSPGYADCYVALSDIEYWQSQAKNSLNTVENGLKANPDDVELLSRKARALAALNQNGEAKKLVSDLVNRGVDNEIISQLKKQLK